MLEFWPIPGFEPAIRFGDTPNHQHLAGASRSATVWAMVEDKRYLQINGRRWRRSDPDIPESLAAELVDALMSARRQVKAAGRESNAEALARARACVQDAKLALGERGTPWWESSDEAELRLRTAAAMRALLRKRGEGKTICPSEAARIVGGPTWRDHMERTRSVARKLVEDQWLEIVQQGKVVVEPTKGPIRLRRRTNSERSDATD